MIFFNSYIYTNLLNIYRKPLKNIHEKITITQDEKNKLGTALRALFKQRRIDNESRSIEKNIYREGFLTFLRSVWTRLPQSGRCRPVNYHCTDGDYSEVVQQLSLRLATFLFFDITVIEAEFTTSPERSTSSSENSIVKKHFIPTPTSHGKSTP